MSNNKEIHYDEYFKRTLLNLYQSCSKTKTALCKEYQTALIRWIKQYTTVQTNDGKVMTAKQVKQIQTRLSQLEEENLILKKRFPSLRYTQTTIRCGS